MNKEMAWFLGYLFSDGSVKDGTKGVMNFICKYDDRELMYKVKAILKSNSTVYLHPEYGRPQAKLRVADRKDVWERYQNIKTEIPVDDIKGYERHFIRGAFDGDGCLSVRKGRGTFRVSFTDDAEGTAQWIADWLCKTLYLPEKTARWSPQNNTYEIQWEGITARLIAWYLYHGDISNCCLERKRAKYTEFLLEGKKFDNVYDELIHSIKGYIDEDGEIAFTLPNIQTLEWCHRMQKLLPYNTVPVFHNKGRRKYYHLYIPSHVAKTQDMTSA